MDVTTYPDLWQWSVDDLEAFWDSIFDYFKVEYDGERSIALASREMPGAEWFPGVRLNWAERAFAGKDDDQVAILHASELRELEEITWGELRAKVAAVAGGLRGLGRRGAVGVALRDVGRHIRHLAGRGRLGGPGAPGELPGLSPRLRLARRRLFRPRCHATLRYRWCLEMY